VVGTKNVMNMRGGAFMEAKPHEDIAVTIATSDPAKKWDGYGTALKPAYEPIILAIKPCGGTFANNALTHGVAGFNIDEGRIEGEPWTRPTTQNIRGGGYGSSQGKNENLPRSNAKGRWPANIILDEKAGAILDEQAGERKSGAMKKPYTYTNAGTSMGKPSGETRQIHESNTGGASRFFYCAKASKHERGEGNNHPTVKPQKLIEYLIGLLSPPKDSVLLDPFAGSGSISKECERLNHRWIAVEMEEASCEIAVKRIDTMPFTTEIKNGEEVKKRKQGFLF